MSVPVFDNSPGDHYQWFSTGDSFGRPLHSRTYKNRNNSPVVHLPGGGVYRYPTEYYRMVAHVQQHSLTRAGGFGVNVCGEWSGTLLANTCGGHFGTYALNPDFNLRNEVIARCMNRIGSQKAELGATLAEARKTIDMIAGSSITLLSAYRAARRGNWRQVLKLLGSPPGRKNRFGGIPNRWLEYQYGWRPLMGDIHGTYQVFQELMRPDPPLLLHAKSVKSKRSSGSSHDDTYDIVWQFNERHICRVDAFIEQSRLRTASQLGLIDPLSIGWELVPFSFLLDWFMPVGNVLSAISASAGLQFKSGSVTFSGEGYSTCSRYGYIPGLGVVDAPGSVEVGRFDMYRYPLGDFPIGGLYTVDNPISTARAKNALALFLQAI